MPLVTAQNPIPHCCLGSKLIIRSGQRVEACKLLLGDSLLAEPVNKTLRIAECRLLVAVLDMLDRGIV